MKHGKKTLRIVLCVLIASAATQAFSQGADVAALLEGYLAEDLSLRQLSVAVERQRLSSQLTGISNGISVRLSTGTVTITTGDNAGVTFSPSAQATIPQAQNMAVSVTSSLSFAQGQTSVKDTRFGISADILSGAKAKRDVTLLKAERSLVEAERKLSDGYLTAEKNFYTELKSLYSAADSVVSAQKTLYDDRISFEQVQAQGYSQSSSKYRTAYMKVVSDEHSVSTAERDLERKVATFAAKCGVDYEPGTALSFLPTQIPQVEGVDVLSFDKESYSAIESASWSKYINALERDGNSALTLTADAGFTIKDSRASGANSVDASASLDWNGGLSVNGGVRLPVGSDGSGPTITIGATVNPLAFKTASLEKQSAQLAAVQDDFALESAQKEYDNTVVSRQTALADLEWQQQVNAETLELYSSLESDNARWYRQGIITESEWRSSVANKESCRLKTLVNAIDLILYNDETRLLFCRDGENL